MTDEYPDWDLPADEKERPRHSAGPRFLTNSVVHRVYQISVLVIILACIGFAVCMVKLLHQDYNSIVFVALLFTAIAFAGLLVNAEAHVALERRKRMEDCDR